MFTRRGFLAGTAAAFLADATDPLRAQQTQRPRVIDIHAHWYPPQWLELIEKESGENGARIERNARGNMVIVIPGLSVTFQPQYTDIPSRLKTMDQAGVTMHAVSLTQPMVYWATPRSAEALASLQ
jgi:aminocarboxymuconate-semialdehyde decarboxylase